MTTLKEAAEMALDALENVGVEGNWEREDAAVVALREALDAHSMASDASPVAWMHTNAVGHRYFRKKPHDAVFNPQAVYVQPPRREWLGLTHEERDEICKDFVGDDGRVGAYLSLALEVEVRLTEKNRSEE